MENNSMLLSVGESYDYPLLGGEWLYDLLPVFNEKFSLSLTEDEFDNIQATILNDGLVGIEIISHYTAQVYQFINMSSKGVIYPDKISFFSEPSKIIHTKPVKFKKELDFLNHPFFTVNVSTSYSRQNAEKLFLLSSLLTKYSDCNFTLLEENAVSGCILRYYGKGDSVPDEYGVYDTYAQVAIIDVPNASTYDRYCLKTGKDYVLNYWS